MSPEERYQTARDLHRDLSRFYFGDSTRRGEVVDSGRLAAFMARLVPPKQRPMLTAGAALRIVTFDATHDLGAMAALMAASDPWLTLGRSAETCLAVLSDTGKERYAAFDGDAFAGFLILNLRGAFVGYLQTVFVAPQARGRGTGSALIAFAEERIFSQHPNVFLCVSAFNTGARRLYERLGYATVGVLSDFLTTGQSELLLRKTRGPIGSYRPRATGHAQTALSARRPSGDP